ncbi:MAG: molybdopterin-guanine dinucleotide biosynthesis protein B [Halobacteriaceae archaeon]
MKVLGVVGDSDAGKTTVIEALLPELADRGRVASIKSIHHPIEVDEEGKDTHRHRVAGADTVVGITPTHTFTVETTGKSAYPTEADALQDHLDALAADGFEYVLVEGFSTAPIPKVVVGDPDRPVSDPVIKRLTPETVDADALADILDGFDPDNG